MITTAKPWEQIQFEAPKGSEGQPSRIFRLKVPGGWLVTAGVDAPGPLVFVADPNWDWDPTHDPPAQAWK